MFKRNFYLLSIVILFSMTALSSLAKDSMSKFLPKTKDTNSNSKDSIDTKTTDDKNSTEDNEEEVDNPENSFKLVAIYLVGNKPRALIKNLDKPEDPAKEFQTGDYVDELQTFSISKILLNPTARIELTDLNGLSYVIKEKNADGTNSAKSSKTSKTLPSYFSGSNKVKIKRAVTTSTKTTTDTAAASTKPVEKKEESASLESAIKNDAAAATATPPPAVQPEQPVQNTAPAANAPTQSAPAPSAPSTASQTQTGTTKDNSGMNDSMTASDTLDRTRPANPFGE